jgi:hypothetical protein
VFSPDGEAIPIALLRLFGRWDPVLWAESTKAHRSCILTDEYVAVDAHQLATVAAMLPDKSLPGRYHAARGSDHAAKALVGEAEDIEEGEIDYI